MGDNAAAGLNSRITATKTSPELVCDKDGADKHEEQLSSHMCDHGGTCNLPLAYLATLSADELSSLGSVVAFDFSQVKLTTENPTGIPPEVKKTLDKCADFWSSRLGWTLGTRAEKPWGETVTVSGKVKRTEVG